MLRRIFEKKTKIYWLDLSITSAASSYQLFIALHTPIFWTFSNINIDYDAFAQAWKIQGRIIKISNQPMSDR